MYRRILVPSDGSELSAKAVDHALNLAKMSGARVTVLHVIPLLSDLAVSEVAEAYDTSMGEGHILQASLQTTLHEAIAARRKAMLDGIRSRASAAGIECDTVLAIGSSPHEQILNQVASSPYDLIVMASHGRKGVRALVLGSETNKVLVHSKVPVLVVH